MKRLIVICFAAVAMAACSSDADTAAPTSPSTVTAGVVETAAPTSPPSTTVPLPESTTSTTTSTTLPETTTTIATEDQIKQAVQDYIAAYFACGQAPAQCDPATFTATQGPSRGVVTDLVNGMKRQGLYFSTNIRSSYVVAESVSQDSADEATANYCAYDGLIVLGPNGPDGVPTVVNDAVSSSRYTYTVYREAGVWIVGEQQQVEQLGEGNLCPAA